MHAAFIPYGKKEWVDIFLRDVAAQKYQLPLFKGNKIKHLSVEGQLRILPFGIYEHIFPREAMNEVLTTLNFKLKNAKNHPYLERMKMGNLKFSFFRKMLGYKKAPEFKTDKAFFWIKHSVSLIPIGIKEDEDMTEKEGEYKGWRHEAI